MPTRVFAKLDKVKVYKVTKKIDLIGNSVLKAF